MTDELEALLERTRDYVMTPQEREAQRRDFVYGNVRIGNMSITRAMVDEIADRMAAEAADKNKPA